MAAMDPMVVGDKVRWSPDGDLGVILAIDEYAITIAWEFYPTETYKR